jgi:hypothetical protein
MGIALLTILLCNFVFALIYGFSYLIPKQDVIHSLQEAQATSVLKTPLNSIERSTTGWGIDYGTECVALSTGLKDKTTYSGFDKLKSRFYDGYLVSGANVGVFDPCAGLTQLLNLNESPTQDKNLISYARNWWGMSVLMHTLIWLIGLASAKMFLYIGMVISMATFYYSFSRQIGDYRVGILFLFPVVLFGDFQELHNSFPYSIFTIELFVMGIVCLNLIKPGHYSSKKFIISSTIMGCIYNFIFWLDFHIVLTFIPVLIFMILYRKETNLSIFNKMFIFGFGFGFGFIVTALIKWLISVALFGNEILLTIKDALNLRLGSDSLGVNQALSQYSSGFTGFPLSIRAIVVNTMVFASKYIDPRAASSIGITIFAIIYLFLLIYFIKKMSPIKNIKLSEMFFALLLFLIPFGYYFVTPNHSFNHAVVTYRAISISFGFLLSFMYISKIRPRISV